MRKYDPNGKGQMILTLLCTSAATMDQVYEAAGIENRPNVRKKYFHVMISLVEDALAQRSGEAFSITRKGIAALECLLRGDAYEVPEATPGVRHRSAAA